MQKTFVIDERSIKCHLDVIVYIVLMYNLNPHWFVNMCDVMNTGCFPLFNIKMRAIAIACTNRRTPSRRYCFEQSDEMVIGILDSCCNAQLRVVLDSIVECQESIFLQDIIILL